MPDASLRPLRALILEDDPLDAELVIEGLKRGGFQPTWRRVQTEAEFLEALNPGLDVILSDFNMPSFDATRALDLLKTSGLDVPFIVVSGSIGEELAVETLQNGAADYLLKDRLARLGQAVERALDAHRLRRVSQDAVDALRAAEARMRFALEASQVGIWEVDLATGAARWSDTLEAQHGLAAGTFAGTFEAFIERIHPEDRQAIRDAIAATPLQRVDSSMQYRTVWADGTTHWISLTGRPVYDEEGKAIRAAGIGMDVTGRRALEEQYRQSQKMEAIGQLAGGVAHDFNNVLTAIHGFADLLSDEIDRDSPHQADLAEIRRAAARAASLTRQLLAFSRRQIVQPRTLDLRESLASMHAMLTRLIGEHIAIEVLSQDEVWPVTVDPGQMEQVLLNLVLNARDAMPLGGRIRIELSNVELDELYLRQHLDSAPGSYVMLAVGDTGTGMSAATLEHIFEPFYTTKEFGKGTGLGLSTVYGIVRQHGGSIGVSSELGQGTTFKIYLPRAEAQAGIIQEPPTPVSVTGSETVMVVDDEVVLCELVRRALEKHGYKVLVASTPQAALEISASADTGVIDLLLSDVVLPEMNGPSMAARIRQERPDLRVLYMSGYTESSIVRRAMLEPGAATIQKPFTPQSLLTTIREVLGSPPAA
jgi:PAS domain S-box-containing protein